MAEVRIDLEWLLKLRIVIARCGEMDLARWWNTSRQLGTTGASVLRRGFPRTHHFAQTRSVIAVARHRCAQVFDLPGCVTLWRMPDAVEEAFETRWEDWLDSAATWRRFFDGVARIASPDVIAALQGMNLVDEDDVIALKGLNDSVEGRAVQIPGPFLGERRAVALLALGFAAGAPNSLVVPYARQAVG